MSEDLPLHFTQGGVVMVSFNYRLGIFGFLSTNDAAAQGNWALKDMVEALRCELVVCTERSCR
jgi:carboxylesterase type B